MLFVASGLGYVALWNSKASPRQQGVARLDIPAFGQLETWQSCLLSSCWAPIRFAPENHWSPRSKGLNNGQSVRPNLHEVAAA